MTYLAIIGIICSLLACGQPVQVDFEVKGNGYDGDELLPARFCQQLETYMRHNNANHLAFLVDVNDKKGKRKIEVNCGDPVIKTLFD